MKKLFVALLCLTLVFACAACAGGEPAPAVPEPAPADAPAEPEAPAEQEAWKPTEPIAWVIPYGAGGQSDLCVRSISAAMGEILGATFLPENKTGGGGAIAAEYTVKREADGYTITMANTAMNGIQLAIDSASPYSNDDFTFICMYLTQIPMIVVQADSPYETFADYIAAAQANPGTVSFCTSGVGTSLHFVGELIQSAAGVTLTHIPYTSGAEMAAALMGGHVESGIFMTADCKAYIESGDFRPLAVTSEERSADFPDVPTLSELGYSEASMISWHGIAGPAGMDQAVVDALAAACEEALKDQEVHDFFTSYGVTPQYMDGQEFHDFIYDNAARLLEVAENAGIRQ